MHCGKWQLAGAAGDVSGKLCRLVRILAVSEETGGGRILSL